MRETRRPTEQDDSGPLVEEDSFTTIAAPPETGLPQAGNLVTAGATGFMPLTGRTNMADRTFENGVRFAIVVMMAVISGVFLVLLFGAWPAIQRYGLGFLVDQGWDPVALKFGALPFIVGTFLVAGIAIVLAGTVGLATAVYITEFAPRWLREPVSYLVELLAFIPSVVYGLWGLLVMAPFLQQNVQPWLIQNLGWIPIFKGAPYGVGIMSASLILSIMLLPLVVALSREALLLVPDAQKEAMYALGATHWEVVRHAIVPYARTGIFGSIILALGRALGETMAVAMTIGGGHQLPKTVFDQGYTLASVIANEFNEVSSDIYLSALIYCGLILFIITMGVNLGANLLLRRITGTRGLPAKG